MKYKRNRLGGTLNRSNFDFTTLTSLLDFDEFKTDPMSETLRSLRTAYLIESGIQLSEDKQFVPSFGDEGSEPPVQG